MSKKSGISRTLKYTGLIAENAFGMIFMAVAIYVIIYYFQGGVGYGTHKSFMIPFYFGMISLIMLAVIQIVNNSRYIPISISFGSLRKETFIGVQWINLILIVQCVAVLGFSLTLIPGEFNEMKSLFFVVYIILLFLFGGLGQLIGAASIKFGKLGGLLIAALILIVIISGTVALALGEDFNAEISLTHFSLMIKILASSIAVIVYLCGSYINYRVLKNYEVRA